jgi:hypothetical protein
MKLLQFVIVRVGVGFFAETEDTLQVLFKTHDQGKNAIVLKGCFE